MNRRDFLTTAVASATGITAASAGLGQAPGERPKQTSAVKVLNPRSRVPVSLIIDDSTCLVNLAHFCIPQFAEVFPDQYKQPWQTLPREIPDSFVRKFGEWCGERGVKGKYSLVPYPACVGWLDRDIPGWSKKQLDESLKLVRTLLAPNWDFHPEMITHTWVIDTKTGRPYPERSQNFMENWGWSAGRSVDELADYLSYALRILKNVDIPCEGVTTPGGFGNRALPQLSQATLQSCRSVFSAEIPHYFRHLFTGPESVVPRVEYASGLETATPQCVVSIIGCTGDWFGGWDGLERGSVDKFITGDLNRGRMVEVIDRGEPAIMVCHWPGIYFNGEEVGFNILKEIHKRLHARYDNLVWMKLSEIARYWAAKELTVMERPDRQVTFRAPFACPSFTVRVPGRPNGTPKFSHAGQTVPLREVKKVLDIKSGYWAQDGEGLIACFGLPKGRSVLEV
jgi:hypothetical protein